MMFLLQLLFGEAGQNIHALLQRTGFEIAERRGVDAELFVTEKPQALFVEFTITFRCIDTSGTDRGDGVLTLRGDGFYDSLSGKFFGLGELGEELKYSDADGVEQERKNIVLRAGALVIGHKDVSHIVRHKLD